MTGIVRHILVAFAAMLTLVNVPAALAQGAVTDTGYVLGPGDVIEVSVLGQPEFTTRGRVRADGTIVLPFVGSTTVAGDTSVSFAKRVGAALKAGGFYASPIPNVEIASYASRYVIVLGAVRRAAIDNQAWAAAGQYKAEWSERVQLMIASQFPTITTQALTYGSDDT